METPESRNGDPNFARNSYELTAESSRNTLFSEARLASADIGNKRWRRNSAPVDNQRNPTDFR
jgi:hypothetical protein